MNVPIQPAPGRGRYLVSATDGARLLRFIAEAHGNPELHWLETLGPAAAPHTAVYEMPHDTAARLQQSFGASGELKIEPDRPLSMFGSAPSSP